MLKTILKHETVAAPWFGWANLIVDARPYSVRMAGDIYVNRAKQLYAEVWLQIGRRV